MKRPLWILPLMLATGLGAVHLLPHAGDIADSAITLDMPESSGDWQFRPIPPSEEEVATLAKDTKFSKAICLSPRPGEFNLDGLAIPDRVDLSIVLSGHDLNNSIHRPERCMPAQGHNITDSRPITLKLKNGRELTVRRLRSIQSIATNEAKTEFTRFDCVTYYFFVGHDRITHDHVKRTLLDMQYRLTRGVDQRWAYISASMWHGKVPWIDEPVPEEEADEKLRQFLTDFAETQIDWDQVKM